MQYIAAFLWGKCVRVIASVLAFAFVGVTSALAAPITFNSALPISEGEFIIREQLVINQSDDSAKGMSRDRLESSLVSTLVYGVTPDFALFGTLPYKKINPHNGSGNLSGIGDTKIFGRYTVYQGDSKGQTFRVAPFAGLKMPTHHDGTGSDSWDVFGGVSATYSTLNWAVDAQVSYQENTRANAFEAGDVARADASVQYRLSPWALSADTGHFFNSVLEANLIHKGQNKTSTGSDFNSGGTTLFIVPGVQYITQRYIIETGLQIPVMQNLNGTALENGYILRTGFRINF
jgi:hypothetical protein